MNSMHQRKEFYQQTQVILPKKVHNLYALGFWILSCERVDSIRGNVRHVIEDAGEAKRKAWRLLKNDRLRLLLPKILPTLDLVKKDSVIAIDFSTFGKWLVLMFAIQTHNGRAIPVYFEIITYPIEKDSQNTFIITAIEHFAALIGFRPTVVFDRGFACPSIINYLANNKHLFIIRIKAGKHVAVSGDDAHQARTFTKTDLRVSAYGQKLRLVISPTPATDTEPWYLITNDRSSSRTTIIDHYYHRFEIEEFFKDAKWLHGLEHTRFKKIESVTTLLWFVLVGWWCFALLVSLLPTFGLSHPHDRVSWIRRLYESLQLHKTVLALSAIGVRL